VGEGTIHSPVFLGVKRGELDSPLKRVQAELSLVLIACTLTPPGGEANPF